MDSSYWPSTLSCSLQPWRHGTRCSGSSLWSTQNAWTTPAFLLNSIAWDTGVLPQVLSNDLATKLSLNFCQYFVINTVDLKIQKPKTRFPRFSFQKPTSAVWEWFFTLSHSQFIWQHERIDKQKYFSSCHISEVNVVNPKPNRKLQFFCKTELKSFFCPAAHS